jgi:hypothetical protein
LSSQHFRLSSVGPASLPSRQDPSGPAELFRAIRLSGRRQTAGGRQAGRPAEDCGAPTLPGRRRRISNSNSNPRLGRPAACQLGFIFVFGKRAALAERAVLRGLHRPSRKYSKAGPAGVQCRERVRGRHRRQFRSRRCRPAGGSGRAAWCLTWGASCRPNCGFGRPGRLLSNQI